MGLSPRNTIFSQRQIITQRCCEISPKIFCIPRKTGFVVQFDSKFFSLLYRTFIGLLPSDIGLYHFRRVWSSQLTYEIVLGKLFLSIEVWISLLPSKAKFADFFRANQRRVHQRRSVFLWLVLHFGYFGLSGLRALSTPLSRCLSKSLWLRGNTILKFRKNLIWDSLVILCNTDTHTEPFYGVNLSNGKLCKE